MEIVLNGKIRETSATNAHSLLKELGMRSAEVLLEINAAAISRDNFPKTELKSGDRVEILQIAAGG